MLKISDFVLLTGACRRGPKCLFWAECLGRMLLGNGALLSVDWRGIITQPKAPMPCHLRNTDSYYSTWLRTRIWRNWRRRIRTAWNCGKRKAADSDGFNIDEDFASENILHGRRQQRRRTKPLTKTRAREKTQRWHSRRILSSLWENLAVERWHIWYRPFRRCCCFWQCLPSVSTFYSPHLEAATAPAAIGSTGSTTSRSWSNKIVTQKLIIFECLYSAVRPLFVIPQNLHVIS